MSHNITVEGGKTVRLPTAGKYCDRDIVVTATGGSGDVDLDVMVEKTFSGEYKSEKATIVGFGCFYGCKNLTYASFPNATNVGAYAFQNCSNIAEIHVPNMTGPIGAYTFAYCAKLKELRIPLTTSVAQYAFSGCTNLELVELGNVSSLGTNCFANSTKLAALIIRRVATSVTSLPSVNVFSNTAISKKTGYIYVPATLVDSYKTATNWSTYASQIRAIEDYPEITGG